MTDTQTTESTKSNDEKKDNWQNLPEGLYVRIYGRPEITSVADLDIWAQELTSLDQVFAVKISGPHPSWYVTSASLLNHQDIPLLFDNDYFISANARNRIWRDVLQLIGNMNLKMALNYATLPVHAEDLLLVKPGKNKLIIQFDRTFRNVDYTENYTPVGKKEYEGLSREGRVALLLSQFISVLSCKTKADRYRNIYMVIEQAEELGPVRP